MQKINVLDVPNEEEVLESSDRQIHALDSGIHAIALDFGFHIKNTFNTDDKIFDSRGSISYRLRSSRYHFHLLFKELNQIQQKHDSLPKLGDIRQSSEYQIELDKRHLTYILDSLIFHLSSVFDYSAILINYILSKNTNTPPWSTIENSARAQSNIFKNASAEEIKKVVLEVHNRFVRHLYDYRSEIIHRQADLIKGDLSWSVSTNKKTLLFRCSKLQLKSFKNLSEENVQVSVPYFSKYLIFETIEAIVAIVKALRIYMTNNSKSHELIKSGALVLGYADPVSKTMRSPGIIYWNEFDQVFPDI